MSSRQSVRHPSHNHPLRSHKCEAKDEIICSGCDLDLIGAAFKCTKSSECDYFLHKSCFSLPRETNHKSHQPHCLTLLYSPKSMYTCQACGEYGSSFTYNCSICQYDVHVGCVSMPETVKREDHAHPLTLLYSSPYTEPGLVFTCDVCKETVPDNLWAYYCMECDYGTHLHSCAKEEEEAKKGEGEGSKSSAKQELAAMLEAQREMENMQIEIHLAMQSALFAKKANKAALSYI
ncbi:unnamed protein product [Brassica oleracea var. botrytis]|uniref:DC1 domain-containing protein n=6 Tax=Brassica TaxID=3705 RepID=A0A0D3CT36_BRAOL|nr:PREDICTED: uncharacterized protein LOC106297604 [Brassica oleracea var. oleracea]KAF3520602.1 hypothetical protein DY000_02061011 [Brassica cretica]CAF2057958.1 unnamed protein product [Brassica napus]CDY67171.1 BnaCnng53840D [Brassica napus]VDD61664.1 unnamed protein product [Brassica oleracea]